MTAGEATRAATAGISDFKARVWEKWYVGEPPPWEIDKPQPVLVELAEQGRLAGRVLDVGCGTGENVLLAAEHGAEALGIDISPTAIKLAGEKASKRELQARFQVGDALRLDRLGETFDVVIDSGTFQSFDPDERSLYASSLASVLEPDGTLYVTCVSDQEPDDSGPRRVSEVEIRTTFTHGWLIEDLRECLRERRPSPAIAWLATIHRNVGWPSDDRALRTRVQARRLHLENRLLELELISRTLQLARDSGVTVDELGPVVRRLVDGLRSDPDLLSD